MDIDRVRYFQIFSEAGSVVRASELLHISQPALSKALRLLESEVGLKLIEAEGRGLRLTVAGHSFKNETKQLLAQWLSLPDRLRGKATVAPTRIGTFEVFSTYFLGQLAEQLPLENLELHEFGPGHLEEALTNGRIDIGITYLPIPKAGIEFIETGAIKMGVFGLKKFRNMNLMELPFVIPLTLVEGAPSKIAGLDGWPDHRIQRNIKYRVTMMESALELCRRGLCVAYLPEFVAHLHNQQTRPAYRLVGHPSPLPQKERLQKVFLLHRKQDAEAKLHRLIAKSLRLLA